MSLYWPQTNSSFQKRKLKRSRAEMAGEKAVLANKPRNLIPMDTKQEENTQHKMSYGSLKEQEENRMEIPIIAVLIGLIPAAIAQSKGRSVLGFWILSFVTLCFITLCL